MAAHARLKNEFTEDEKCHLMSWLILLWSTCFSLTIDLQQDATTFWWNLRIITAIVLNVLFFRFLQQHLPQRVFWLLFLLALWNKKGMTFELSHNKITCASSEDSDQPGHPPSLISLCCPHEEALGPMPPINRTAKTDQTGQMPRLIWVLLGAHAILLVLLWGGSFSIHVIM